MKNPFEKSNRKEEYKKLSEQINDWTGMPINPIKRAWSYDIVGLKNEARIKLIELREKIKSKDHNEALKLNERLVELQNEIDNSLKSMHAYEEASPGIRDDELHSRVQKADKAFKELEKFQEELNTKLPEDEKAT